MKTLQISGMTVLEPCELLKIRGGTEPAQGSYAAGYAVGSWFREMYNIWSYGLTHLTDR